MDLGLGILGGRRGVSTGMELAGSGKGESQGGEALEREEEGEGWGHWNHGRGVKGASVHVPMRCLVP